MATILSIESSGSTCGVGLIADGIYKQEISFEAANIHDRMLADSVKKILSENELPSVSMLDAVAVSSGPGSFTGIRIGASIAKGLCFGNEPKFIAVPTMNALAKVVSDKQVQFDYNNIIVLISSVNNTAFISKFDNNLGEQTEIELIDLSELSKKVNNNDILCGIFGASVETILNKDFNNFYPLKLSPKHIAVLGAEMYAKRLFTNPEEFKPIYAQEFVPKIKLSKLNIKN